MFSCISNRFKYRAWDIEDRKYREVIALGQDRSFLLDIGHVRNDTQIFEQCTGLKDKNGRLIFEGDILKSGAINYTVEWGHGKFILRKGCTTYPISGCDLMEIVGNIHVNKELLK